MKAAVQQLTPQPMPMITVDWQLAFEQSVTQEAAAYWMNLRGDRPMPARGELRPAGMRNFLTFVNLVDVVDDSYIITLQGAHARQVLGHLANQKFVNLFTREEEERWRYCLDLVRDNCKPVRLYTQVGTQQQLWLDCEVLIAPLGNSTAVQSLFWIFVSWRNDRDRGAQR